MHPDQEKFNELKRKVMNIPSHIRMKVKECIDCIGKDRMRIIDDTDDINGIEWVIIILAFIVVIFIDWQIISFMSQYLEQDMTAAIVYFVSFMALFWMIIPMIDIVIFLSEMIITLVWNKPKQALLCFIIGILIGMKW